MKDRKAALLLTILAGVLWGTSFPAIKIGLLWVNPYVFVSLRMLLASLSVLLISYATKTLDISLAKERLVWYLGLLNGVAYLVQYLGMSFTTASKSSLFVNLSAVWVAVLSRLVLKEVFPKKKMLGIASGLTGVFLISTNLSLVELTQGMIIGDGLVLLSGVLWSFFIVYNKKVVDAYNVVQFMPWLFLATALPLTPLIFVSNGSSLLNLPNEVWILIVYTAIFCWLIPLLSLVKRIETHFSGCFNGYSVNRSDRCNRHLLSPSWRVLHDDIRNRGLFDIPSHSLSFDQLIVYLIIWIKLSLLNGNIHLV